MNGAIGYEWIDAKSQEIRIGRFDANRNGSFFSKKITAVKNRIVTIKMKLTAPDKKAFWLTLNQNREDSR